MLEPTGRHLLLEALRPPSGTELDIAIGLTFTLDLQTLLLAPLAFAMFSAESEDEGEGPGIASLEAVRRTASRIHIFCQAGEIAVPREYRMLMANVEKSIHQVQMPGTSIFHPKLWALRFVDRDGGHSHRILCLSRNLTFDRAWDTIVALESQEDDDAIGAVETESLVDLLDWTARRTVWPLEEDTALSVQRLTSDLSSVNFALPTGFEAARFWTLLPDRVRRTPLQRQVDRTLAVSPFLTKGAISYLTNRSSETHVVSRPESFDALGASAFAGTSETSILSSAMLLPPEDAEGEEGQPVSTQANEVHEALASSELSGLHAKVFVLEEGDQASIVTGSMNLTDAGLNTNTELLIELRGGLETCGIDKVLGIEDDIGLRHLLEGYPAPEKPVEEPPEETIQIHIEQVARSIASQRFLALVGEPEADRYSLTLSCDTAEPPSLEQVSTLCWPISAAIGAAQELSFEAPIQFAATDIGRLTSFFAVEIRSKEMPKIYKRMVINARLVGAPEDREQKLLAKMLDNIGDFFAYLRALLAQLEGGASGGQIAIVGNGAKTRWLTGSESLLEPLLKSLTDDLDRLDHVARLIEDLEATPEGRELIPQDFRGVWQHVWKVRESLR